MKTAKQISPGPPFVKGGTKTYVKGAIAPSQIKAIHAAKGKLGLDMGVYWQMLRNHGCKDRDCNDGQSPHPTSKDLTWSQAEELLEKLNGQGKANPPRPPFRKGGSRALKYTDMDSRPGFASGAQCRLIDAMWNQVTRAEGEEAIETALNSFCHRIAGVAGLRMVKVFQVEKIVKALEAMGAVIKPSGGKP